MEWCAAVRWDGRSVFLLALDVSLSRTILGVDWNEIVFDSVVVQWGLAY